MQNPLLFKPVYKSYIWGGTRIAEKYGRAGTPAVCAESWEVSGHPDGESVVAEGPHAGQTLAALVTKFGAALVGTKAPDPKKFPLLFKLIDAKDRLSVQVHPSNASAPLTGGAPKTEMWYVLGSRPGACLYAGLDGDADEASLRKAIAAGRADALLNRYQVGPGEAFYIPGGLVHAIGAGCLIYEIQQSSNTTYRLYDWNRKGADGKGRPLHVEEAMKTIDWDLPAPKARHAGACGVSDASVVTCRFFCLRRIQLREVRQVPLDGTTFHVLFTESGAARVTANGESVTLKAGTSCLVPAAAGAYTLEPVNGNAIVLRTTL